MFRPLLLFFVSAACYVGMEVPKTQFKCGRVHQLNQIVSSQTCTIKHKTGKEYSDNNPVVIFLYYTHDVCKTEGLESQVYSLPLERSAFLHFSERSDAGTCGSVRFDYCWYIIRHPGPAISMVGNGHSDDWWIGFVCRSIKFTFRWAFPSPHCTRVHMYRDCTNSNA